ncbi:MAG: hypothetical protein M1393_04740 [Candidatus Thermoplasmatota archaeon]|nr:hypothetical protein [Candidatus Thermoplasmatota archaeon]
MAKQEQANVGKEQPAIETKPEIVYRGNAQGTSEKTFSFTISQEQSDFIKAHRKPSTSATHSGSIWIAL